MSARATRTRVQAWIANGQVTVNGTPVRRVASRAAFGDVVAVTLPRAAPRARDGGRGRQARRAVRRRAPARARQAGRRRRASRRYKNAAGTLMNALLWHARGWPAPQRPSLVGRLDKLTSGVVIVAKTAAIHAALQRDDERAAAAARKTIWRWSTAASTSRAARSICGSAAIATIGGRVVASATVGAPSLTRFERLARVAAPARRAVAAALPARDRPHASDPRPPRGARLAACRRSGLRRTALVADRRRAARRDAARVSTPGAPRVAGRADASRDTPALVFEAPVPARNLDGLITATGLLHRGMIVVILNPSSGTTQTQDRLALVTRLFDAAGADARIVQLRHPAHRRPMPPAPPSPRAPPRWWRRAATVRSAASRRSSSDRRRRSACCRSARSITLRGTPASRWISKRAVATVVAGAPSASMSARSTAGPSSTTPRLASTPTSWSSARSSGSRATASGLAFALATARILRRYRGAGRAAQDAGRPVRSRTAFLFVGNNEYQVDGLDARGARQARRRQLFAYLAPRLHTRICQGCWGWRWLGRMRSSHTLESFAVNDLGSRDAADAGGSRVAARRRGDHDATPLLYRASGRRRCA